MPKRTNPSAVEQLEDRTLLTPLTVITHGFQSGPIPDENWVFDMARAVNERAGYGCSQVQITNSRVAYDTTNFAAPANGCANLLVFDWAELSNNAGTADNPEVAGVLTTLVRNRLPDTGQRDLHFIGHSRGSYVIRAAIEGLIPDNARVGFLQMTTLDPENFGTDGPLNVPANVDWADNYFQTDDFVLGGNPIPGANINLDLTAPLVQWPGRGGNEHSEAHDWYHWTIDLTDDGLPPNTDVPVVNETMRGILFDSMNVDLDMNGSDDLLAGGSKVGFFYSLGDQLGPRSFAGFGGVDLVFVIDLTGSMFDDIDAVKTAAQNIVNDVFRDVPNAQIGIVSFKDFPMSPYGESTDFPSRTELPFTRDRAAAVAAIQSLSVGGGNDFEESVYSECELSGTRSMRRY